MQLAVGAAAGLVNALLHTKGKLVKIGMGGSSGGGSMLGKLGAAAASMSPIPIPGLGAVDPPNEVSFMFNPTEYRLSRSVTLNNEESTGMVGGNPEYLGTGPLSLSMDLFFDDFASAKGDVTPKINKLFAWQLPDKSGSPPHVLLDWGANAMIKNFKGVLKDVSATYTVFNKSGTPIQAKVSITLEEVLPKPAPKAEAEMGTNPTSHALDARRVHVVVEGDTLASIAHAEYGEPGYWRALAEVNGIDDPMRVRPGANILIPSAADAARLG
jgi:hypothetical protein